MTQQHLISALLGMLALVGFTPPSEASILVDTLQFQNSTFAQDSLSGNQANFEYQHQLPHLSPDQVLGSILSLQHKGNSNIGPTKEIWFLETKQGQFLGQLSNSESDFKKDSFTLPLAILQGLLSNNSFTLELVLSEQTSFNREKIELKDSELVIRTLSAVSAPEPHTVVMFIIGIAVLVYKRKRST